MSSPLDLRGLYRKAGTNLKFCKVPLLDLVMIRGSGSFLQRETLANLQMADQDFTAEAQRVEQRVNAILEHHQQEILHREWEARERDAQQSAFHAHLKVQHTRRYRVTDFIISG